MEDLVCDIIINLMNLLRGIIIHHHDVQTDDLKFKDILMRAHVEPMEEQEYRVEGPILIFELN